MQTVKLKQHFNADHLSGKFLAEDSFDTLIQEDTDGYTLEGELLFKFRKNKIPFELVLSGYEAFKKSIQLTDGRALASGVIKQRINKDGKKSKQNVGNPVLNGVVGFMDHPPGYRAQLNYCRKTGFTKAHFEKYKAGIPFVKQIDKLYSELCPEHYAKQIAIAKATNTNYRIDDTAFTTITVNKNFVTAVHKDVGDYKPGFGNLCVYRSGSWQGAYFCLPEYRVAIDIQNTDMLFVDVHRWHGNTPLIGEWSDENFRVSYVAYYREYMIQCKTPALELAGIKKDRGGFLKL